MLAKMGVDYSHLEKPIRKALNIVDKVFKELTGREAVLSSTYEGDHMAGSLHYAHLAVDFRLKDIDMGLRDVIRTTVKKELASLYGNFQYDVLFSAEDTCLHVEYDPK